MPEARPRPSGHSPRRPRVGRSKRAPSRWGERLVWLGVGVAAGIAVSAAWAFAANSVARDVLGALTGTGGLGEPAPVLHATPAIASPAGALPTEVRHKISSVAQSAVDQALAGPLPAASGAILPDPLRQVVSQAVGQAVESGLSSVGSATADGQLRSLGESSGPGYSITTFGSVRRIAIP